MIAILEPHGNISLSPDTHEGCETCLDILQGLENIDDDADRQNIALVKTTDPEFAEEMGIQVRDS